MYDVVTLGEAMLRLSPPNYMRLEQTDSFDVNVGGSELNTSVGVARFGMRTAWVTKLVKSPLGRMVANKAREHGIDTSHIVWVDEGRVGIYYLELGSTPRASRVIYDRKDSAVSKLGPGEVLAHHFEGDKAFSYQWNYRCSEPNLSRSYNRGYKRGKEARLQSLF